MSSSSTSIPPSRATTSDATTSRLPGARIRARRDWQPTDLLRTPFALGAIAFFTLITALWGQTTLWLTGRADAFRWFVLAVWTRGLLWACGVRVHVHGQPRPDPRGVYVYLSNHQSHLDIPVLFQAVGTFVSFVAKKELARIPIFGPGMVAVGTVTIDRKDREGALKTLREAGERLRASGVSMFVFPEGTRSGTGDIKAFKKGAFQVALDLGLPLLPVVIEGTHAAVPSGSWIIRPTEVDVYFLPPIDPKDFGAERRDALINEVRESMVRLQRELRGESNVLSPPPKPSNFSPAPSPRTDL